MPQLVVNTGANAWLFSSQPNTVQPHSTQLQVGKLTASTMRALLVFSLSGLPAEAGITSAVLRLWQQSPAQPAPPQAIYRVKFPWHADQATWNRRLTEVAWAFPGGDYWSSLFATHTPVEFTPEGGIAVDSDIMALFPAGTGGSELNILLRNVSEASGTARVFYDPFAGAHPPTLTINYVLPASGRQRLSLALGVGV